MLDELKQQLTTKTYDIENAFIINEELKAKNQRQEHQIQEARDFLTNTTKELKKTIAEKREI